MPRKAQAQADTRLENRIQLGDENAEKIQTENPTSHLENSKESLTSRMNHRGDRGSSLEDKIGGLDQYLSTSFGELNDPFTGVASAYQKTFSVV